jgi:K319-like protein
MLCGTGRLVTGPQCQNLFTGTNTCANGLLFSVGVCIPTNINTNTGVPTTTTCPPGSTLQNGVCVPFTNPVQSPPVANAGQPQTVPEGSLVFLDGSTSYATTSGAYISSYSWTQTSGTTVGLDGATFARPSFTAPSSPATFTFSLTVTDSLGQVSQPSSVTVTVVAS